MLPRRVGGVDISRTERFLFSRFAEFQDQLFKLSKLLPMVPFEKGCAGGVVGRERGYPEGASRILCSSMGTRLGEEGQWDEEGPDPTKGGGLGCQPWARMSAEVCRLVKLLGGGSTDASG